MIKMRPGYNLVERRLLRKEFEEIEERMSIIEFLRRLRSGRNIPMRVAITGLEKILLLGKNVSVFVRQILADAPELLRNSIIQFIIDGRLILDAHYKIKVDNDEVRLEPIFGLKIKPIRPGYFYAPFYI